MKVKKEFPVSLIGSDRPAHSVRACCTIIAKAAGRERERERERGRQAGRQTDRQTGRQTDRQTDRGRQTDRQTDAAWRHISTLQTCGIAAT